MSQVKLISEWFVRPETEPDVSKRQYHLGSLQLSFLPMNYVHTGYVFTTPRNYSASSHCERLKFTLSRALVHFYPLAGRLETQRFEDEHSSCIYVDCSKGPGAKLIHAAAPNVTIYDIVSPNRDVPTSTVQLMFDLGNKLVNHDGHNKALLVIQVTELADGVFFGFSANHSVIDGTSTFHFLKVWEDLFRGLSKPALPWPIIRKSGFLDEHFIKLPYLESSEFITRPEVPLRERFFQFSSKNRKKLKARANAEAAANSSSPGASISSFKALSAFVWRCVTRARDLPSHEDTTCALPVNLRPHLSQPLSTESFGSYLMRVKGSAKVGELLENNMGWAAGLLHEALESLDDEAATRTVFTHDYNEGPPLLVPSQISHSNHVVVAGSPLFDVAGPAFGLGVALAIRSGFGNKSDGKVRFYAGLTGGGSVDLEICLAPDTMRALLTDREFMSYTSEQNAGLEQNAGVNLVSRL